MTVFWFFSDYSLLFNFGTPGNYQLNPDRLFLNVCFIWFLQVVADVGCLYILSFVAKLDLSQAWDMLKSKHKGLIAFILFGAFSMAVLSIIYFSAKVPRALFCSSQDICSCRYPHLDGICSTK
jgi:hypothetical protein